MENGQLQSYAWPGGYPIFYVAKDGGVICPQCCNENLELLTDRDDSQWFIVAAEVNYEDQHLTCEHCSKSIECAYCDSDLTGEE